jgi:CheY-like chemotaxis protein
MNNNKNITVTDILKVLSNYERLLLFRAIAGEKNVDETKGDILMKKLKLTSKQYYTARSCLISFGLVKSKNLKYSLTLLGNVFYYLQAIAEASLNNYWKLKAIESIQMNQYPNEDLKKLIEIIIDDKEIKEILTNGNKSYYQSPSSSSSDSTNDIMIGNSSSSFSDTQSDHKRRRQEEKHFSINIMIIEDEPDLLETYKYLLVELGYNVDGFTNPYEALKTFLNVKNSTHYDLIIMDIRMPKLNGLQLYQMFRAVDDSVKVIFITALDAAQELIRIFPTISENQILRKPISKDQFVNIIKNFLY